MKIVDIVIVVVIVAAVCAALWFIRKNRKSGGCSCGCANCDKACRKANKK